MGHYTWAARCTLIRVNIGHIWLLLPKDAWTPQWIPVVHPCVVITNENNQKAFFLKEDLSPHHVQQRCRQRRTYKLQIESKSDNYRGCHLICHLSVRLLYCLCWSQNTLCIRSKLLGNQWVQLPCNCWNVRIVVYSRGIAFFSIKLTSSRLTICFVIY